MGDVDHTVIHRRDARHVVETDSRRQGEAVPIRRQTKDARAEPIEDEHRSAGAHTHVLKPRRTKRGGQRQRRTRST